MNLDTLLTDPRIRAAGFWVVESDELVLRAFQASGDMPIDVAEGFADATRRVSLEETSLGIVGAALEGATKISRAVELPPDHGSGLWLRRFGAECSMAVPKVVEGRVTAVLSVAILGPFTNGSWSKIRSMLNES